jgi:hypothetical protein
MIKLLLQAARLLCRLDSKRKIIRKDNPKVLQLRLFPESPIVAIIDDSRFT